MRYFLYLMIATGLLVYLYNNEQNPTHTGPVIQPDHTPIPKISAVDSVIASDLYSFGSILEFKTDGRPFETTDSSRQANRIMQNDRISSLMSAAASNNKTITSDIEYYRVAWRIGDLTQTKAALEKTVSDLATLRSGGVTYYDPETPLGLIIASMIKFRENDDAREKADRDDLENLERAKAAAGVH